MINASTKKYTQEKRIISYWFKDLFPANERAGEAQEFFKKLVSPVNFPRGKIRLLRISKGAFGNVNYFSEKGPSSIHSVEDYEWGLTENKKYGGDGTKDKINKIRLTRHALAFKKGLAGKSKSGSSSSLSSSGSSDEDRDGASTLNGVEDMPENLERKDGSDDEEVFYFLHHMQRR